MKKTNTFTLVEIMIVVAIIGLLAAIAVPSLIKAREKSRVNTCIGNLRQINSAKESWAMDQGKSDGDAVAADGSELVDYFQNKTLPTCPLDATKAWTASYTPGNIGTAATCIPGAAKGHVLGN